jgi:programmed cell death protein 5
MEEEQKRAAEERVTIVNMVLQPRSLERLQNIKIVDAEKYFRIESLLVGLFKSGRVRGKLEDQEFVKLMSSAEGEREQKVIYSRRAGALDL